MRTIEEWMGENSSQSVIDNNTHKHTHMHMHMHKHMHMHMHTHRSWKTPSLSPHDASGAWCLSC